MATLRGEARDLKRILPAEKETPELMSKVQYLAAQSNLTIKKFNPAATVNKEFPVEGTPAAKPGARPAPAPKPGQAPAQAAEYYQEWPINVDLDGTYHNLGMFFDRVGRLSRLVNVGNIKIKAQANQTASNTIAASCVATTFVYVDRPSGRGRPAARAGPPEGGSE